MLLELLLHLNNGAKSTSHQANMIGECNCSKGLLAHFIPPANDIRLSGWT